MGLRLSPFLLFFWPLPLAARAAVVATFLAWLIAAFLRSEPFIMAKAAALVANKVGVEGPTGPFAGPASDLGGIVEGGGGMVGEGTSNADQEEEGRWIDLTDQTWALLDAG